MSKTLGIVGGGQLGRMSAQAAKKLGIPVIIYTPEKNSPASQVADETIMADYTDEAALKKFADKCDYISYEFENIPVKTVRFLQSIKPVYPDDKLLEISQDRLAEKTFLNEHGIPTANFAPAHSASDIQKTLNDWQTNTCIIKTTRFGYDGKGQVFIRSKDEIQDAWNALNSDIVIIEELIDFECEISVIIARDIHGKMEAYGPCLNDHANHILSKTTVPAPISDEIANKAILAAKDLAHAVNLVGVLALEMFVTKDGQILANEIAPRTHNSGHWTIDACEVSQFENHVRTACAMDVAPPKRHSDAAMLNLIGDEVKNIAEYEGRADAHIHLYGKDEIREGRKMGHITITKDKTND